MKVTNLVIPGVTLIEPDAYGDSRGFFLETFSEKRYREEAGIEVSFVQDNHSLSQSGVLRGLHYQVDQEQDKLISVIRGRVFDVVVDLRRDSKTFRKWIGIELTGERHEQLFVPAGFAHGFCTLEESHVVYKCSEYYSPECERGLLWNDSEIGIEWPLDQPELSARDLNWPILAELKDDDYPIATVEGDTE